MCIAFVLALAMAAQLTVREQDLIAKIVSQDKRPGSAAVHAVNALRAEQGIECAHKTNVYRFINGATHRHARKETRGRGKTLTKADARSLHRTRLRLIK